MNFKDFYLTEKAITIRGKSYSSLRDAIIDLSKQKKSFEEIKKLTKASDSLINQYADLTPEDGSRISDFFSDLSSKYEKTGRGQDVSYFLNDKATANLNPSKYSPNAIHIDAIVVDDGAKGGGHGTKAMLEIIKASKRNKVDITLQPSPSGKNAMSIDKLTKWYEKFGFIPFITDKNERIMIRRWNRR